MYGQTSGGFFRESIKLDGSADVAKAIDIGAASGTHGELLCVKPCKLKMVGFIATEEAVSGTTTAPTVVFKKRPTPLSSSGESTVATLTVASGAAIGSVTYKSFSPVSFSRGDALQITWTVGVGTPTGIGHWFIEVEEDPEVVGNNSDMVASA
jgi:hypothetical protein